MDRAHPNKRVLMPGGISRCFGLQGPVAAPRGGDSLWGQSELAGDTKACPGASAADKGIKSRAGITASLQCHRRISVSCSENKRCRSASTFIPNKDLVICAVTRAFILLYLLDTAFLAARELSD